MIVTEQTSVIRDQVLLLKAFNNERCSLIETGTCFTNGNRAFVQDSNYFIFLLITLSSILKLHHLR